MTQSAETQMISGPTGALEVLAEYPDAPCGTVAVLCHPHPLYGGSLSNKVVHTLAAGLRDLGIATVRFNFRGVGRSEGVYDEGRGEQDDLQAVLEWARRECPAKIHWLGGFSFGAYVALSVCDTDISQLITVAPPVNLFTIQPEHPLPCPWLLIQGEADDIVPASAVSQWLADNDLHPQSVFIPAAGHFFHGRLNLLRRVLAEHLTCD